MAGITEITGKQAASDSAFTQSIAVNEGILSKNDLFAARNRARFKSSRLLVLNVVSSPGSGKTALIERTLTDLRGRLRGAVIVGDLATDNDAQRIARSGAPAVQITTGDMCHLEAEMVGKAANQINLDDLDLLIIENVGNLVCPSGYDLGEDLRVVLLAATGRGQTAQISGDVQNRRRGDRQQDGHRRSGRLRPRDGA